MILFILFIFFANCSVTQQIVYTSSPLIRLKSFGFEKGGTFNINITTPNITNINMFLVPEQGSFIRPNTEIGLSASCEKNSAFISEYNESFPANTTASWSGIIKDQHVFYPYIVNCNRNSSIYKVVTDFKNPSTHLDYRDNYYSMAYIFISFIYTVITFLWIINALSHPKFWISLHAGFSFVSSTKAVLCSLESKMWEDRRIGIISYSQPGSICFSFFIILHYTSFLTIPVLAMSGWCIFRKNILVKDVFINVFINLCIVLGIWPLNYIKTLKEIFFSVTLLSIGSIAFLRKVTDYIIVLSRLEETIPNDCLVSKKKITLITRFTSSFLVFGIGYMIAYILSISFNFWSIIGDMIIELGYLILTCIELYFFLIRKNYEGEDNENSRKDEPDYEKSICYLVEPNFHDIAIVCEQNN